MAGLCEAFPGRLPSELWQEIQRLPAGMLDEILEARAYQEAKRMVDAADTDDARKRLPKTPLFALVTEIEFELAGERIKAKRKKANG